MQIELSDYEKHAGQRAKHRALIMQILWLHPEGLATQQIQQKEVKLYGYSFLTDNRLRELRELEWVKSVKGADGLLRWFAVKQESS